MNYKTPLLIISLGLASLAGQCDMSVPTPVVNPPKVDDCAQYVTKETCAAQYTAKHCWWHVEGDKTECKTGDHN